ncbi:MAG: hypothetical protein NTX00_02255 [Candidatus Parcubacteria bacterium]|nr:hypothetical protein [Candidatus Parcubacteria bacterium]
MEFKKDKGSKINWLTFVMVFILGALILSNIFLFLNNLSLQKEVEKLKADDIAIAQAVNNLLGQLKAK